MKTCTFSLLSKHVLLHVKRFEYRLAKIFVWALQNGKRRKHVSRNIPFGQPALPRPQLILVISQNVKACVKSDSM